MLAFFIQGFPPLPKKKMVVNIDCAGHNVLFCSCEVGDAAVYREVCKVKPDNENHNLNHKRCLQSRQMKAEFSHSAFTASR